METKKIIVYNTADESQEIILPDSVNSLFINNDIKGGDYNTVLNISIENDKQSYNELMDIWKKLESYNVIKLDIYINENLVYSIDEIKSIGYVVDFIGDSKGERIGIHYCS